MRVVPDEIAFDERSGYLFSAGFWDAGPYKYLLDNGLEMLSSDMHPCTS